MSTGYVQKTQQKTEQKILQKQKLLSGMYAPTEIPEEVPETEESIPFEEAPDFEDFETEEDDVAGADAREVEEGDCFADSRPDLLPVRWLWLPAERKSRLLWATLDPGPRLGAMEIFRLFVEDILNVVHMAEQRMYPSITSQGDYLPPDPLALQSFFVEKDLSALVKVSSRQKKGANTAPDSGESEALEGGPGGKRQLTWKKHLSRFTIGISRPNGYVFLRPDLLIANMGRGSEYLPKILRQRWLSFENRSSKRELGDYEYAATHGDGWYNVCLEKYVKKLNEDLWPLFERRLFENYKSSTLKNMLLEDRKTFWGDGKKRRAS